ncbi:MAG: hypothetical protein UR28_C0039G0004 [Candidatus Peregrinibacteria bacterium GW2011_GWF2_33_10]|nr:MAG: hypothetical protein UR28_C0039G0004 [Candidatus Peregrinibacteria bacterium GW2011_GWF2_33_10]OGJ44499.1 MAG: hypothetical protein A2263_05615 [Candidatus Peregrinibacteria bacterium RIFOXYA2_FULL_33_21]OGJ44523.1 MAG: hypothetical protein A2272_00135 [Candidatus Peregrinibacteria bacterium RIFOXYA12_FULL_33_12]OGJ50307.1 MAG: hypothetical protein A2307_06195 [Candidatus Peregrinibacteria bacterium RIFOXYB2_FULL_33_20]
MFNLNNRNIPIYKANTFWKRFVGLAYRKAPKYGLIFENCRMIHTVGMCFKIDVFCLDGNLKIIYIKRNIKPLKIFLAPKETKSVVEIPSDFKVQLPSESITF